VLIGARGRNAIFTGADLSEIYSPKASLPHGQFREATLELANLVAADLSGADMTRSNLSHANLQETNLQNAVLADADLSQARLDFALLTKTDLRGANLASAVGVTQAQLDRACVDERTALPADLSR